MFSQAQIQMAKEVGIEFPVARPSITNSYSESRATTWVAAHRVARQRKLAQFLVDNMNSI